MRKTLLVLALIFGMTGLAQAQQKQLLSVAGASCTTTGTTCLIYLVDPSSGGATFTVSANASSNTIQFEATGDGGQTWVALNATPSNSTTAATSTTSTGTWQANVAGYTGVRMRMSALVSGTTTVSIITSIASARAGGGGGGGGGVTSFSGDGTVITNSASTGAVTTTIAGTSGGVPYFNTATGWASSGALASTALVVGGGAGTAPTTGNGDFTYATHTLTGGASGLVDLHSEAAGGLRVPNVAFGSIGTPAAGSIVWNTSNGNPLFSNGAALIWLAWAGAAGSGSTTCYSQQQYLMAISATAAPTCLSLTSTTASNLTSQKSESAADASLLSLTPTAAVGTYRLNFVLSLSAATAATIGWTATWKDSNGNAQSPTNLSLIQEGTGTPAVTFVAAAAGNYYGSSIIDIDNSATAIVVKLTFTGTSFAGKATAAIERLN